MSIDRWSFLQIAAWLRFDLKFVSRPKILLYYKIPIASSKIIIYNIYNVSILKSAVKR